MAAWSEEEDAKLRVWRKDGQLSCTEMAVRLGNGRSRNAVIGRLARLGLVSEMPRKFGRRLGQKDAKPRQPREQRTAPPRPRAPILAVVPMPADRVIRPAGAPRVTVESAEPHHCRFVHGDPILQPNTWTFCGEDKAPGMSFCDAHCSIVYPGAAPVARDPHATARVHSRNKTAAEISRLQIEFVE